jgi:hypothetical protein
LLKPSAPTFAPETAKVVPCASRGRIAGACAIYAGNVSKKSCGKSGEALPISHSRGTVSSGVRVNDNRPSMTNVLDKTVVLITALRFYFRYIIRFRLFLIPQKSRAEIGEETDCRVLFR